jgi:hypothetical protein
MATDFPTNLDGSDTLPNPGSGDPTNAPSLSTAQTNQNDAIKALEAKVGANSSAVTSSLDYKLSHLTSSSVGLANVNNTSDANKPVSTAQATAIAAAVAAAMQLIFPIGAVYTNTGVATNPASLLGFGTWAAIGAQVLAGYASGDANFGTPGASVGGATHFHWQTVGADSGGLYIEADGAGSGHTRVISVNRDFISASTAAVSGSREDGTYDSSSIQPSLTVYMWQRTA